MREIKFRGWNKEQQIMCFDDEDNSAEYWDGIRSSIIGLINHRLRDVGCKYDYRSKYVVMQYTGLKDKNGREIYEGDIIDYVMPNYCDGVHDERTARREVEFAAGCFWLASEIGDDALYDVIYNDDELEIVGNIHENPDLLEITND